MDTARNEAQSSQARLYSEPPTGCTLVFTEPRPAHLRIKERILASAGFSVKQNDQELTKSVGVKDRETSELSDHFISQLTAEARRPFAYDVSNEVRF